MEIKTFEVEEWMNKYEDDASQASPKPVESESQRDFLISPL